MDDFQRKVRELRPLYSMCLGYGWLEDNVFPEFRSDIFSVDTAAYGDVVVGTSNMFCFGELTATIAALNHMPGRCAL